jgi:hypothetical protein
MSKRQSWVVVVVYAIGMAWVESAVVVYLRTLINRIVPYQSNPLPMFSGLGEIELGREAATLVMLLTVGWLAGRTWRSRLAYAAIAFGVWDIFYYIFLVPMSGWPHTIFDWDILFLLPLPWWGPVIAPVSISVLMIIGGTIITQFDQPATPFAPRRWSLAFAIVGVILALGVFMADAIRVANGGVVSIRSVLPTQFNWSWFAIAITLMTVPIFDLVWQVNRKVRRIPEMRRMA